LIAEIEPVNLSPEPDTMQACDAGVELPSRAEQLARTPELLLSAAKAADVPCEIVATEGELLSVRERMIYLAQVRDILIVDAYGLAPAVTVLTGLEQIGSYVVPGDDPEQPRRDLKRPWDAVTKRAGLVGVRLHDLRHTYASFGAGGGLGLPIIGRLLGHSQAATTARYAHLDNDPLRRASEAIAGRIAAALEGNR
jgi:site-specific recombinase XerD